MPRSFRPLAFLTRRSTSSNGQANEGPAMVAGPVDADKAPVGPPVLLPATIVRQVLVHATELTPIWARPRPDPEPVAAAASYAASAEPTARKRTRRAATGGTAKTVKAPATPRRTRRTDRPQSGDA